MDFGPGVSELSSLSSAEDTALLENTRKDYDVVVFGATGFTGKLTMRYFLEEQLQGLDE